MAATRGSKSSGSSGSKKSLKRVPLPSTVELAQELAVAVIREYGIPDEIMADLKAQLTRANVDPEVVRRLGTSYFDPHVGFPDHSGRPPGPPPGPPHGRKPKTQAAKKPAAKKKPASGKKPQK